jgi:hypothetical protein
LAFSLIFAAPYRGFGIFFFGISGFGAVAQSVEQRTENPCVAGSIPAHTTTKDSHFAGLFHLNQPDSAFYYSLQLST